MNRLSCTRVLNVNARKFRFEKEAAEALFSYVALFTEMSRRQRMAIKRNVNFLKREENTKITKTVF